jgi:hypothetical protein
MQKIIKKTIKRKKDTDKKSEDFNKKKLTIKQEKFANFYVEK